MTSQHPSLAHRESPTTQEEPKGRLIKSIKSLPSSQSSESEEHPNYTEEPTPQSSAILLHRWEIARNFWSPQHLLAHMAMYHLPKTSPLSRLHKPWNTFKPSETQHHPSFAPWNKSLSPAKKPRSSCSRILHRLSYRHRAKPSCSKKPSRQEKNVEDGTMTAVPSNLASIIIFLLLLLLLLTFPVLIKVAGNNIWC